MRPAEFMGEDMPGKVTLMNPLHDDNKDAAVLVD